jgi:hypothetical protein
MVKDCVHHYDAIALVTINMTAKLIVVHNGVATVFHGSRPQLSCEPLLFTITSESRVMGVQTCYEACA